MDFQVGWTRSAVRDVEEIVAFVAKKSPDSALRLGQGLLASVKVLRSYPSLGPAYPSDEPGDIREISYKSYRIFYEVHADLNIVEILAVWHAARGEPPDLG